MTGKFLAEFELYVMLAIERLGEGAYGGSVRREIEERAGRPVSIGALYATLARLEAKDMVQVVAQDPQPGQRGRPRKACRLTGPGREALRHSLTMLGRMTEGLTVAEGGGK